MGVKTYCHETICIGFLGRGSKWPFLGGRHRCMVSRAKMHTTSKIHQHYRLQDNSQKNILRKI